MLIKRKTNIQKTIGLYGEIRLDIVLYSLFLVFIILLTCADIGNAAICTPAHDCNDDSDCAAGEICVLDELDRQTEQCVDSCTCRAVENIALGTVMSTRYCAGAWTSGGFTGGGAGSFCGDHAYNVPANPAGNLCVRYSAYDQDDNSNALFLTMNQTGTEWDTLPPSGADAWRYNYIFDIDDTLGNFFQLEIREYDTGYSDFMYGYLLTELGATDGTVSTACCPSELYCVYDSVQNNTTGTAEDYGCYAPGSCYDTGSTTSANADEYCNNGTWQQLDSSQTACDACMGAGNWSIGGIANCCGDDANEYVTNSVYDAATMDAIPAATDACCNQTTDCVHNNTCYNHNNGNNDRDGDGDDDWCDNGTWRDCRNDGDCTGGLVCDSGDCVVCNASHCATKAACRTGAICCDDDAECGAGRICVNDEISANPTTCYYGYQCRDVENLAIGTEVATDYSGGAWTNWNFLGAGVGSGCGDHGYNVPNNPDGNLCFRYSVFDSDGNANTYVTSYNHDTDEQSLTPITANNQWRYNYIYDVDDALGNFVQVEVREWDTGLGDMMYGYLNTELGDTDGVDSTGCCDQATDCVDDSEQGSTGNTAADYGCYDTGVCRDTGSTASTNSDEYCDDGTWRDNDFSQTACDTCLGAGYWNLGGDILTCCGDDADENIINSNYSITIDGSPAASDACCDQLDDCTHADTCYVNGSTAVDTDGDTDTDYCLTGTWYDCLSDADCAGGDECDLASNDCKPPVPFDVDDDDAGVDTTRDNSWDFNMPNDEAACNHGGIGDYGDRCGNVYSSDGACVPDGIDGICVLFATGSMIIDGDNDGVWDSDVDYYTATATVVANNGDICSYPYDTGFIGTFTADRGGGSWTTTYFTGPGSDAVDNDGDSWIDESFRWDASQWLCVECDTGNTRRQATAGFTSSVGGKTNVVCESACGADVDCDEYAINTCPNDQYICDGTCNYVDRDNSETQCRDNSGCTRFYWNIGGEVDPTFCCGNDAGEYRLTTRYHSSISPTPPAGDACCDTDNDCVHDDNCYAAGSYHDVDSDGDQDYCHLTNRRWYDCWTDSDCPAGELCSGYSCTPCAVADCRTHSNCWDGTVCCDDDAECGPGRVCINDQINNSQTTCYYGYSCRDVETLALGTEMTTFYSAGAYGTGAAAGSACGDHAYWMPASPAGNLCMRYATYDADNHANTFFTTLNHDTNEETETPPSGGDTWRYNYIRDVDDTVGNFTQLEIREYDTGYSYVLYGYLLDEVGETDGANSQGCCDSETDCVDDSVEANTTGTAASYGCYDTGVCHDTGSSASTAVGEYCDSGTWRDNDFSQTACDACLGAGNWALGGDVAAAACCGDDAGENSQACTDSSVQGDCGADTAACCDLATDCVDDSGVCQTTGTCHGSGVFANAFCDTGSWEDPDEDVGYCIAACDLTPTDSGVAWNIGGIANCCGDDMNEYVNDFTAYDAVTLDPAPGSVSDACCATGDGCVDSNICYPDADNSQDIDLDGDNDYCDAGTWRDCNTAAECPLNYACTSNNCTALPVPTITNINPNNGVNGTLVTITGTLFGAAQGASTVTFNGTDAGVAVTWTNTEITINAPDDVTTGPVIVRVGGAQSIDDPIFTVNTPAITSLTPNQGYWLDTIIVDGANFGHSQGSSFVEFFDGVTAVCSVWTNTSLTCTVPHGAATGDVTVTTVGGGASNAETFTLTADNSFWPFTDPGRYTWDPDMDVGGDLAYLKSSNVPDWYDFAWYYRRRVAVSNGTGSDQAGMQVDVNLTSANFDFSHANTDGSDIRFTDDAGNPLDYWIESFDSVGETAKIWVRVDNLLNGGSDVYMYYGNSGASNAGSFNNVFDIMQWTDGNPAWTQVASATDVDTSGADAILDMQIDTDDRTCSVYWDADCSLADDDNNTYDTCPNHGSNTGFEKVLEVTVDHKKIKLGDTIQATCRFDSYNGSDEYMYYYDGTGWTQVWSGVSGSVQIHDVTQSWAVTGNAGTQWVRCINDSTGENDECADSTGTRYDNDDVLFYAHYLPAGEFDSDDIASFMKGTTFSTNQTLAAGTDMGFEIRRASDNATLCNITSAQAPAGYNLTACSAVYEPVKVYAQMTTSDDAETPAIQDWTVDYQGRKIVGPQPAAVVNAEEPAAYYNTDPTIVPKVTEGFAFQEVIAFREILGSRNAGEVKYQVSNDYATWYWWNGANWVAESGGGFAEANDSTEINANIRQFDDDVGAGTFYFRAYLHSDGTVPVEIDGISINIAQVTINEFQYKGIQPGEGDQYVELYNPFSVPYDLSNHVLSDGSDASDSSYTFPAGETIAPNSYYLLVKDATEFNNRFACSPSSLNEWATMDLGDAGDELYLVTDPSDTISLDLVVWGTYDGTQLPEGAFTTPPGTPATAAGAAGESLRRLTDGYEGNEKDTGADMDASPENEELLASTFVIANPATPYCIPPTTGTITINDNSGYTNDSTVTMTLACDDPLGTSCNAGDYMRFACSEADLASASWSSFEEKCNLGGYTCTFDITTGPGCNASEGSKTIWVEYMDEVGNIQWVHASDTTYFDITDPGLNSVTLVSDNETYFYGTSDGLDCTTAIGAYPAVTCTAWFNSLPTQGGGQNITVSVDWSDVSSPQDRLDPDNAFNDLPPDDTSGPPWTAVYSVENNETDQLGIDYTVYDMAGNSTALKIDFRADNLPPDIIYNYPSSAGGYTDWYNADPGAVIDVDFDWTSPSAPLDYAQFNVFALGWEDVFTADISAVYSTDWTIGWATATEGENEISIVVSDVVGNVTTHSYASNTAGFWFRKDTIPPVIDYNSPASGAATIWYSEDPGAIIDEDVLWMNGSPLLDFYYRIGAGAWTAIWSGAQSSDYTADWAALWSALSEGENEIHLAAHDAATNGATDTYAAGTAGLLYRKDMTPPDNPSALLGAWDVIAKNNAMTSGNTYGYDQPYFEWSAPSDNPGGANAGVAGYRVGFSTDPNYTPATSEYQADAGALNAYTAATPAAECDVYYLRVRTVDDASPQNATTAVTLFQYTYTTPAVVTDNQPGDNTWYSADVTGVYFDVDFNKNPGCGDLDYGQYTIYTGVGGGGTMRKDWTDIFPSPLGATGYTTDWTVDFTSLAEGENYVSARAFDPYGGVGYGTDVFYIRIDDSPPDDVTGPADGWASDTQLTVIADGGSYIHENPYFEWAAPADNPVAGNAGVAGYYVAFSTDPDFMPTAAQTGTSYTATPTTCGASYTLIVLPYDAATPTPNVAATTSKIFEYYFECAVVPDYLVVKPEEDGLILEDLIIADWCDDGTDAGMADCTTACISKYCSNTTNKIQAKPDYVKYDDSGANDLTLANNPDDVPAANLTWTWDSTNNRVMLFNDPAAATIMYTPYDGSEKVCVYIYDEDDNLITNGKYAKGPIRLDLSDAPNSGKDITENLSTSDVGFTVISDIDGGDVKYPDQIYIRGNLKKGVACIDLTAEDVPNDTPMSPIRVDAGYYNPDTSATETLPHVGGAESPAFVYIREGPGVSATSTSDAPAVTDVDVIFVPKTSSLSMNPVWSHGGDSIGFISRQDNPCGGAAAAGANDPPGDNFNVYLRKHDGGSPLNWTECIRLTSNTTDGMDYYGPLPYSDVTFSTTDDKMIFAATDIGGTGADKLFWISATNSLGISLGSQYNYVVSDPFAVQDMLMFDATTGDPSVFVSFPGAFAVNQQILIGEVNFFTMEFEKSEVNSITAINGGTGELTLNNTLSNDYNMMTASTMGMVMTPVHLSALGQYVSSPIDGTYWLDPTWSADDAGACTPSADPIANMQFGDLLAVVRWATPTGFGDFTGTPPGYVDEGNANPNIIIFYGDKVGEDGDDMYKQDTSKIAKITNFAGNTIWPMKPKWSPDCTKMAFVAWDVSGGVSPSKSSIYIINLADERAGWATATLPVTSLSDTGVYKVYDYADYNDRPAFYPNWSADSTVVAYAVDTTKNLDLNLLGSANDNFVSNMFDTVDFDQYLEYIEDQPSSLGGIISPQIVGSATSTTALNNEFGMAQCPGLLGGSACPNAPNFPYSFVSQTSSDSGNLRSLTLGNVSTVMQQGGLLFLDGVVTAVFPPGVISSDTVFWNDWPTQYCTGAAADEFSGGGAGICPVEPTGEYIVNAGEAREFFPDGTNFSGKVRLIFHYCDNDGDDKVDTGTEGTVSPGYTFDGVDCWVNGVQSATGTIDVDSLGVYNWDDTAGKWDKLEGTVDKVNHTITVYSTHFSRYDTFGFRVGAAPQAVTPLQLLNVHTYPNPWRTTDGVPVRFAADAAAGDGSILVDIKIYDIRGSMVTTVQNVVAKAGAAYPTTNGAVTLAEWNAVNRAGSPLASGVYLYYLQATDLTNGTEVNDRGKLSIIH